MRVLIDTQVLFWWYSELGKLSKRAVSIVTDGSNTVLVSALVAWELAIKSAMGKLDALPLVIDLSRYIAEEGFAELPISIPQATRAGLMLSHHHDPFDRLLWLRRRRI
jgi:PIN domain nuclease of toxin-antitoxin system